VPIARTVLHLGGNGHASIRLQRARQALADLEPSLALVDVPYPGFERRAARESFPAFLDDLVGFIAGLPVAPLAVSASGIGALIALGLRAKGELAGVRLIFQGPVLWGLEQRQFPRLMRAIPPARMALKWAFGLAMIQARFTRKHFVQPQDPAFLDAFFQGYRDCSSFGDFFDWMAPSLLRSLESEFQAHPERLANIEVWVGGLDHVVGLDEVRLTEQSLGVSWPVVEFPTWGHYPMIDVPEEWADALARALAPA
jgi:pimeloyl-ACP methyl ester carboxylesterase